MPQGYQPGGGPGLKLQVHNVAAILTAAYMQLIADKVAIDTTFQGAPTIKALELVTESHRVWYHWLVATLASPAWPSPGDAPAPVPAPPVPIPAPTGALQALAQQGMAAVAPLAAAALAGS